MSRRAVMVGAMCAALVLPAVWVAVPLPRGLLERDTPSLSVEDRFGRLLRTTRASDGSRGGWLSLAEMDADVVAAFLGVEDQRFHRHYGADARAAARAAWWNLRAGRIVSGGSTITMQLARMLSPMPRTWSGKARQALWAFRLERHLGKDAIL